MEQLNMLQLQGVLEPLHLHLHLGVPQVQNHRSSAQIVNGMDMRLQPQCCSPLSSQNPLLICRVQKPLQSLAFHPSSLFCFLNYSLSLLDFHLSRAKTHLAIIFARYHNMAINVPEMFCRSVDTGLIVHYCPPK